MIEDAPEGARYTGSDAYFGLMEVLGTEAFRRFGEALVHEPVHEIKSTRASAAAKRMNPARTIASCHTCAELQVYS